MRTPLLVIPVCSIHDAIHRLTGSLALSIAYGIEAENPDNEFFRMYHDVLGAISEALVPGTFLVDVFPLRGSSRLNVDCWRALPNGSLTVKYLPSWFPGVRFHACANKIKDDFHIAATRSIERVAEKLKVRMLRSPWFSEDTG